MLYGYARVSTAGQATNGNSLEAQEAALRQQGAREVYSDTYTGTKSHRPQLDALIERLQSGDTLIVTKLDRIARSVKDGLKLIDDLMARGVSVHVLNIGMMDNSPNGKLMRSIFLAFAEFERDMIVSRTQEGKAIAKTKPGFKEGRPKEYTAEQLRHALELLESHSYKNVEAMTKISKSTLIRAKAAAKAKKEIEAGDIDGKGDI